MGLLTPLALGFLALALPIILLYMLKLRRPDTMVSSTFLWAPRLNDLQADTPWQRLRKNLLLFLQLLILALLVLAIARPFYNSPSHVGGNVIILLDGSASMQATDIKPSRFEVAKSAAERIIDEVGLDDQITIVLVSGLAEVVVSSSTDKPAAKSALAALKARNDPANFADAIALAMSYAERVPNSSITIVSDGGIGDIPVRGMSVPLRFVPIGVSSDNVAISSVAMSDSSQGVQLFVGLANYGQDANRGRVSIHLDGELYDSREIELGPRSESGLSWSDLPQDTELAEARLNVTDDLAADNAAWALRPPGGMVKTLLVSQGNVFLERALTLLPNVELTKLPAETPTWPQGFDLYVLDGVAPANLPRGAILFVNPAHGSGLFDVGDPVEKLEVTKVEPEEPLLRFVSLTDLRVATARQIVPPEWLKVLAQDEDVPLLLTGEKDGRRVAVLPFDLHEANLPLLVAFPILTSNLVGWLGPSGSFGPAPMVKAGDPINLTPDPQARSVEVKRPDGSRWKTNVDRASIPYAETDWLGVYEVIQELDGAKRALSRFAVNLTDPRESDTMPSTSIPLQGSDSSSTSRTQTAKRELWQPLILAALVVLTVEWWIDLRRRGRRQPVKGFLSILVSRIIKRLGKLVTQ